MFCKQTNKKQKEKKGLGRTAPKHTCRVASTQTQEENAEKSKHEKKRGEFKKIPFQIRKNGVDRRAPAFQTQFGQKFELPKKQICETPKNYSQKSRAASRRYNGSNASERGTRTQKCSETPCFEVFRVLLPLGLRLEDPRPETREKKRKFWRTAKNDLNDLQNGIFEKPERSENSEETWFPETAKNRFRATKTVSKRGGRKWTHETRFGGAANELNSIYIYIYTHIYNLPAR